MKKFILGFGACLLFVGLFMPVTAEAATNQQTITETMWILKDNGAYIGGRMNADPEVRWRIQSPNGVIQWGDGTVETGMDTAFGRNGQGNLEANTPRFIVNPMEASADSFSFVPDDGCIHIRSCFP